MCQISDRASFLQYHVINSILVYGNFGDHIWAEWLGGLYCSRGVSIFSTSTQKLQEIYTVYFHKSVVWETIGLQYKLDTA